MSAFPHSDLPYFSFIITGQAKDAQEPDLIPRRDVGRLAELPRELRSVLSTFGNRASDVALVGNEFRIFILSKENDALAPQPDILELIQRTAAELPANARREAPLPHGTALSSQVVVPILRAVSAHHVDGGPAPTFTDANGTHVIPILATSDFVEPEVPRHRSRTGTFQVAGFYYTSKSGFRVFMTNDRLEVALDHEIECVLLALVVSALTGGLWYEGTIEQADDGSWRTSPGGKLVQQTSN